MTGIDFINKLKEIFKQEEKYSVKIEISQLIDKDHLNCFWYGGQVGSIEYKGYKIVIGAYGDIGISGEINGSYVDFRDKSNSGAAYPDIAIEYGVDDDQLYSLLYGNGKDFLSFKNNNWFEVDLISPDGKWIDLSGADNVLDDNLLDCFADVSEYFEYVDWAINNE